MAVPWKYVLDCQWLDGNSIVRGFPHGIAIMHSDVAETMPSEPRLSSGSVLAECVRFSS